MMECVECQSVKLDLCTPINVLLSPLLLIEAFVQRSVCYSTTVYTKVIWFSSVLSVDVASLLLTNI